MKKMTMIFSLCWLLGTGVFQGQSTNQGPLDSNGATYYDQLDLNGNAPGETEKKPMGTYTYDQINAYTHLIPYLKNRTNDEETVKNLKNYLSYIKNNQSFDSGPDCQTCIKVKIPKSVLVSGSVYEEKERSFFKNNISSLLSINNFFQEKTLLGALGLQLIDAYFDTNLGINQINQITMVFFYNPYYGLRSGKGILLEYSYPFVFTETQGEYVNLKLDFPFKEQTLKNNEFNFYPLDNKTTLMITNVNFNQNIYTQPDLNNEIQYSALLSFFGRYLIASNDLGASVTGLVKSNRFQSIFIKNIVAIINYNNEQGKITTSSEIDLVIRNYISNSQDIKQTYQEIISFILKQMSTSHPVFMTNKFYTIKK